MRPRSRRENMCRRRHAPPRSARSRTTSRTRTPRITSRRTSRSASSSRCLAHRAARNSATSRCRRARSRIWSAGSQVVSSPPQRTRWTQRSNHICDQVASVSPVSPVSSVVERFFAVKQHLKDFLQFLALNRNASAHTVRAYESDLTQFIGYAAAEADLKKRDLQPSQLDRAALRGFLGELHRQGLSRASAARKLAAVRAFLRWLRRENIIADDPGALVPTPKRDI